MGWLDGLFKGSPAETDPAFSDAIHRVEHALGGMPEGEGGLMACLALLMARVAFADSAISEGEKARIQEVLVAQMGLRAESAAVVTAIALESALGGTTDYHLLLRRMNELGTREWKLSVIRTLFRVASVDDVSETESEEIGKVASGLLLPRSEFIALRSEFREHLALLKNLPGQPGG